MKIYFPRNAHDVLGFKVGRYYIDFSWSSRRISIFYNTPRGHGYKMI